MLHVISLTSNNCLYVNVYVCIYLCTSEVYFFIFISVRNICRKKLILMYDQRITWDVTCLFSLLFHNMNTTYSVPGGKSFMHDSDILLEAAYLKLVLNICKVLWLVISAWNSSFIILKYWKNDGMYRTCAVMN